MSIVGGEVGGSSEQDTRNVQQLPLQIGTINTLNIIGLVAE